MVTPHLKATDDQQRMDAISAHILHDLLQVGLGQRPAVGDKSDACITPAQSTRLEDTCPHCTGRGRTQALGGGDSIWRWKQGLSTQGPWQVMAMSRTSCHRDAVQGRCLPLPRGPQVGVWPGSPGRPPDRGDPGPGPRADFPCNNPTPTPALGLPPPAAHGGWGAWVGGRPLTSWSPAWSHHVPASRPHHASPLPAPADGRYSVRGTAGAPPHASSGDSPCVLRGSTGEGMEAVPGQSQSGRPGRGRAEVDPASGS